MKIINDSPYEKRVFYNVISTIEWGESKIIFMQNLSIIDGDSISDDLMLQVNDLGGSQEAYDKIFQNFAVLKEYFFN